jgi:hypothetical protein
MKRRCRQILPRLYRGLTILAQAHAIRGLIDFLRGAFFMRVYGPAGTALAGAPATARRAAAGTFSVSEQATPRGTTAAGSLRSISTLDALVALQGVEDPSERKKRAVTKGRNALDVLEKLKLGLLDGSVDGPMLARLKVASEGLTEQSGDPELDSVLGEIDVRVAVELAKASIR